MTPRRLNQIVATPLLLAALVALPACGIFRGGNSGPKTPVLGERVPVLTAEGGAEADPALASVPVSLPAPVANAAWTQPGGNAPKSLGHLALGASPAQAWTAQIAGTSNRARLAASPVILNGRVYVIDTTATVHAFDAATGATVWRTQLADDGRNAASLFGGGVSVEGDRVYATNGVGDAAALNVADGAVVWKVRPGGPLRGAPTLFNGNAYVLTQDNQLFALSQADGSVVWTEAGTIGVAGVFGVAAPAGAQGTVVVGFSSGDLNAYRYENGRVLWQDELARTGRSTAVATLTDINADPVIDQGRVYAIGAGGRMVALDLVTGQRLWEINVGGISTPWVAGEWVYVVADDGRLLCIARQTGRIRWATQLERWRGGRQQRGSVSWTGPVLAGGRLILASSEGDILYADPLTGAVQATQDHRVGINLPPVVADGTLYLLDADGRLSAWR